MQTIQFTINMVPVAKGRARTRVVGKYAMHYTPTKTREAESNILAQAIAHRPEKPFQQCASVDLIFYMPIPTSMRKRDLECARAEELPHTKKPDSDNLEKAVWDALNGVFWRDDAIIWASSKKKVYSMNPRIEVSMTGE